MTVVVGHEAAKVVSAVGALDGVRIVENADYATGQASSLRAGSRALPADAPAVAVLLGDQPYVPVEAMSACIRAWRGGAIVSRAAYRDGVGHPVVFDRSVWPWLHGASGDTGARYLLRRLPVVDVPVATWRPRDVDTPADLERAEATLRPVATGGLAPVHHGSA